MVKVEIDSIRVSLMSQERVVILKDTEAERYLPIWIGAFEAEAIRIELQKVPVTRPFTHDLLKSMILELGGSVERIMINDLRQEIFFARIVVNTGDGVVEVDSRPSDAIALAVRLDAPIFVAESVMQGAAIEPEDEIVLDAPAVSPEATSEGEQSAASEEKSEGDQADSDKDLSVFEDFLDTLDLDDLGDNE